MKSAFVPGRQREDEDLCYETVLENEQKQLASVGTIESGILKLTIDCLDGGDLHLFNCQMGRPAGPFRVLSPWELCQFVWTKHSSWWQEEWEGGLNLPNPKSWNLVLSISALLYYIPLWLQHTRTPEYTHLSTTCGAINCFKWEWVQTPPLPANHSLTEF